MYAFYKSLIPDEGFRSKSLNSVLPPSLWFDVCELSIKPSQYGRERDTSIYYHIYSNMLISQRRNTYDISSVLIPMYVKNIANNIPYFHRIVSCDIP